MSGLIVAQPRSAYQARLPLVVDSSVVIALLFHEPNAQEAEMRMDGRALHAPHLIDLEVANACRSRILTSSKLVTLEAARDSLDDFLQLDVERHDIDIRATFELASRYGITAYDASFLWLAQHLAAPLATFDAVLGAAATKYFAEPCP